jgi:hypothetical protein
VSRKSFIAIGKVKSGQDFELKWNEGADRMFLKAERRQQVQPLSYDMKYISKVASIVI